MAFSSNLIICQVSEYALGFGCFFFTKLYIIAMCLCKKACQMKCFMCDYQMLEISKGFKLLSSSKCRNKRMFYLQMLTNWGLKEVNRFLRSFLCKNVLSDEVFGIQLKTGDLQSSAVHRIKQLYIGLYLYFKNACECKRLQECSNLQHLSHFR